MKFVVVGTLAAMVNLLLVAILVKAFSWRPLWANVIAFLLAYQVSFLGHYHWTFKQDHASKKLSPWSKFFVVACFSFILNEGLYAILLHYFHIEYMLALFLVLIIVPPVTFVLGKFWAFRR